MRLFGTRTEDHDFPKPDPGPLPEMTAEPDAYAGKVEAWNDDVCGAEAPRVPATDEYTMGYQRGLENGNWLADSAASSARHSALMAAIEYCDKGKTPATVVECAKAFEAYLMGKNYG